MQKRYEQLVLTIGILLCGVVWYAHILKPELFDYFTVKISGNRFAYATFLSSGASNNETEDYYVTATRVLAFQLLHHPVTKTTRNIPFFVLITPNVPQSVRFKLMSEGIQLVLVDYLLPKSWSPEPSEMRWKDQFTKLRLFEQTQYERIVYMDNDMLLTRSLDTIFEESEVMDLHETKNDTKNIQEDEAIQPSTYLVAGAIDNGGPGPGHPAKMTPASSINGGFLVLRPCKKLFAYYRSALEHQNRFSSGMMEMGLLNYAHRAGGNMPWKALKPGIWNSNWPNKEDLDRGSATLHDKFWDEQNAAWIDRKLVEMWWRVQGQMEGYWLAKKDALMRDHSWDGGSS